MRITNKIMQNNSLTNINNNKLMQDKLMTQQVTQSKISRPSDDPVVAIRALRLRTTLGDIEQYFGKNVPDATSWLSLTNAAVDNVTGIITDMYKQCEKGSGDEIKSTDRAAILKSLKELRDEIYSTGDADYEGRSLFTGYRTDSKLMFQTNTTEQYMIVEQLNRAAVSTIKHVNTGTLGDVNETNYNDPLGTTAQDVNDSDVSRIRLSYDTLSEGVQPSIKIDTGRLNPDGSKIYEDLKSGNPLATVDIVTMHMPGPPDPYVDIAANPDKVYFIPETGEMLLGSEVNKTIQALPANLEVAVIYEKTSWEKGDLRPEHYFACTKNSLAADPKDQTVYNANYLSAEGKAGSKQNINYDVGYNQTIQVNTLADEVFTHNIGRDVDEMMAASQAVVDMESVVAKLTAMKGDSNYNQLEVEERLKAAEEACVKLKKKETDLYKKGMTGMQGYLHQTSLAETNIGARGGRLDLISNRLESQQTNFKELVAENEGVDMVDVTVKLESASMAYNAALMAVGKLLQNSLMNFI